MRAARGHFCFRALPPAGSSPSQTAQIGARPCPALPARAPGYPALLPTHPTSARQHNRSRANKARRRPAPRRICFYGGWTRRLQCLLGSTTRKKSCPLALCSDGAVTRQLMKIGGRAGRGRAGQKAHLLGMLGGPRVVHLRAKQGGLLRRCVKGGAAAR